jgi:heme O synthase-like polyprenyltransferase
MMGWIAVTNALDPGTWILGAILHVWQFPYLVHWHGIFEPIILKLDIV